MDLTFRKQGTDMIFHPRGRIQASDGPQLRDAVAKAYELSSGELGVLKVELSNPALVPDEALGVLAEWNAECRREDVPLRFVGVPHTARERFMERGIFGFDEADQDADEPPIVV